MTSVFGDFWQPSGSTRIRGGDLRLDAFKQTEWRWRQVYGLPTAG